MFGPFSSVFYPFVAVFVAVFGQNRSFGGEGQQCFSLGGDPEPYFEEETESYRSVKEPGQSDSNTKKAILHRDRKPVSLASPLNQHFTKIDPYVNGMCLMAVFRKK